MTSFGSSPEAGAVQKCRVLYPPSHFNGEGKSIFLSGSFPPGSRTEWQNFIEVELSTLRITILNPYNDAWDKTWQNDISFAPFRKQVEWELNMQDVASVIAVYFAPNTQAPISLLEFGLFARSGKVIVACPEGFWKRGNVQVICASLGIELVGTLDELVDSITRRFREMGD